MFIGGLFVIVAGGYILYWNWSVHRALASRYLKGRVAWTAILVFVLLLFLGVWQVAQGSHLFVPARGWTGTGVWLLLRNMMMGLSFGAGAYTLGVAHKYDFSQQRRALSERVVWVLGRVFWPWLIVSFVMYYLNGILQDPQLILITELALPALALFIFWPLMVVAMFSAKTWVVDSRLRQNMKWYLYLVTSIALTVWSGLFVVIVLGVQPFPGINAFIGTFFFPGVIYTTYRASKALVMTHKLIVQSAGTLGS